jgi:FlaG/FlaF family flagellin (archaellin)
MTYMVKNLILFAATAVVATAACKKSPQSVPPVNSVPQVTTGNISFITATTARCGGAFTNNGSAPVTASGLCWSKVHQAPTMADDNNGGTTASGTFESNMTNLLPGTKYYVRAYAINSVGTGYGEVKDFTTLTNPPVNQGPEARNIQMAGMVKAGERIVARYTYFDAENNIESATRFQWYVANDSTGATRAPIAGATDSAYIIAAANQNKFLYVSIKPGAAAGTSPGNEFTSWWIGPVAAPDPTTVDFTYNGQPVTYGIITSAVTGRKWFDRNLGAPNTPTAYDDWQNEGDLFQWGRPADGHQLINRAATTPGTTAVNGTTTNLSVSDNPGHALFILSAASPFDWRSPQNINLWQLPASTNNACPPGWHVPTKDEWAAENLGVVQDAYTRLKITVGGYRSFNDGAIRSTTIGGRYWTSTTWDGGTIWGPWSYYFSPQSAAYAETSNINADGFSVRCIKD